MIHRILRVPGRVCDRCGNWWQLVVAGGYWWKLSFPIPLDGISAPKLDASHRAQSGAETEVSSILVRRLIERFFASNCPRLRNNVAL